MKAPPPFHPIDVTVNLDLWVRPIDDDPSVDVEVWNSQLVATPTPAPTDGDADAFDGDPEIPPIVIATSKSYRIDLPNTRYGALEAVTSLDADLAGYQVLLDGDATVFDAYYDILLVIADTTVDPDFAVSGTARGSRLSRSTSLAPPPPLSPAHRSRRTSTPPTLPATDGEGPNSPTWRGDWGSNRSTTR